MFQLGVFLIPTNLFIKLEQFDSSINGIKIDYLIPKLYLSDLPWIGLLVLVGLQLGFKLISKKKTRSVITSLKLDWEVKLLLFLLGLSLLTSAIQAPFPWSSLGYLAHIGLLLAAGWSCLKLPIKQHLNTPLRLAVIFQTSLGIIQWLQRKSIFGYLFLGEPVLSGNPGIAQTALGGIIRPLPYGTTPHPNVLAGFLVVSILLILANRPKADPNWHLSRKVLFYSLRALWLIPALITIGLSQSLSAIVVLILGLALIITGRSVSKALALFIGSATLVVSIYFAGWIDQASISRRMQLLGFSYQMFLDHPGLGVGPHNFVARLPAYGRVQATTAFIQPVHSIYALVLTELGVINTGLIGMLIYKFRKLLFQFEINSQTAPLLALLGIGLVDHYPITLQTGLLLLLLSLVFALKTSNR